MKNSFKLLFVLIIYLFSFQSYSQVIAGIKGGVNFPYLEVEDHSVQSIMGYHIGIQFEFMLSNVFSVESGMYWSTKGGEVESSNYDGYGGYYTNYDELKLNYIDWPITIKVGLPIGDNFKIYAAAGGFLNWGISGKINGEDVWKGDMGYLEKYDYGATFGAGIEIHAIQLSASYDLGLADIGHSEYSINQSVLKASVAYLFW
ncbi:MAG: hypothetical protein DRJ07_01435 [Bacteroidetes bacterium]|nr:MAG: hypothetical protein DRJ07_01435 [Bacteroidota bacterium]